MLSIYRFLGQNAIRFNKSLDLRIDWTNEFKYWSTYDKFKAQLDKVNNGGNGWVDYATTYYWYQDSVGYNHEHMIPLEERIKPLLKTNLRYEVIPWG